MNSVGLVAFRTLSSRNAQNILKSLLKAQLNTDVSFPGHACEGTFPKDLVFSPVNEGCYPGLTVAIFKALAIAIYF